MIEKILQEAKEELDNLYGDIWFLMDTAEETGGCPKFERINRYVKIHLEKHLRKAYEAGGASPHQGCNHMIMPGEASLIEDGVITRICNECIEEESNS